MLWPVVTLEHFRQNGRMGLAGGGTRPAYVNGIELVPTVSLVCIAGAHFHIRFAAYDQPSAMQRRGFVVTGYAKPTDPGDDPTAVVIPVITAACGKSVRIYMVSVPDGRPPGGESPASTPPSVCPGATEVIAQRSRPDRNSLPATVTTCEISWCGVLRIEARQRPE